MVPFDGTGSPEHTIDHDGAAGGHGRTVTLLGVTLTLTGERTLPGIAEENYWFRRHEAAYLALAPFCTGARVADLGCGEGYGAALLRRTASLVVAVDSFAPAVAHVAATYSVHAVRADLRALPLRGVEVLACLQTIEHLDDQAAFVAACATALRPAGSLLVTTPNRLTFSPGRDTPLNPFHTVELSGAELDALLTPHFEVTRRLGLAHGRRIRRWERRHGSLPDALVRGEQPRIVTAVRAREFVLTPDVDSSLDLVYVAVRR